MRPAKTLRGLFWIAWCKPRGTGIAWFLCKSYCTGLLLPGERKSAEPMAARLCPHDVRQTHQSLGLAT